MKTRTDLEAENRRAAEESRRWREGLARARARGFRGLEAIVRGKVRPPPVPVRPAGG